MKHKKAFRQAIQQLQYNDKEKFHSKAQKVKLELLADLWEKAEAALDPDIKTVPALLGGGTVSLHQKLPQAEHLNPRFTRSETQSLSAFVSEMISMLEAQIVSEKEDANYYWELCDPENPGSIQAFKQFNLSRDFISDYKKQVRKLQQIQTKLKKSLRR